MRLVQTSSPRTLDMKFLFRAFKIEPHEIKGALQAFLFIFILMASFQIVKPVRDALPSDWGDTSRAIQWSFTFIISTVAVTIYNFLTSRISLRIMVPGVFIFFALSFLTIFSAYKTGYSVAILGKVFYVWSSVFSLFHISVFWSFISQFYNKAESKRLFSFINTGASAGAIVGPLLVIWLAKNLSEENSLLITAGCLFMTLPLVFSLNKGGLKNGKIEDEKPKLNPNPFSGFMELVANQKLLGIASFIFVFTGISTFFYVFQSDLLVDFSYAERKTLLGSVELITSILTILLGIFVSNRLSLNFGLPTSLGIVPIIVAILLCFLSLSPVIMLVLSLQVLRRAGNYSITRPSREILYTAVSRDARFKTKPIIDVAVYRGGDVFWIWLIALLTDRLGMKFGQMIFVGVGVAILVGIIGFILGRNHEAEEKLQGEESTQLKPTAAGSIKAIAGFLMVLVPILAFCFYLSRKPSPEDAAWAQKVKAAAPAEWTFINERSAPPNLKDPRTWKDRGVGQIQFLVKAEPLDAEDKNWLVHTIYLQREPDPDHPAEQVAGAFVAHQTSIINFDSGKAIEDLSHIDGFEKVTEFSKKQALTILKDESLARAFRRRVKDIESALEKNAE